MQPAFAHDTLSHHPRGGGFRKRLQGVAALMLGLGFAGAGYAAVSHPVFIVRHIPATAPLFALAGSPVNLLGLDFQNVRSGLYEDGPNRILMVEGRIANVDARQRTVPDLRLAVLAEDDKRLYTWVLDAPRAKLAAGESTEFRARLVAPPAHGRRVDISFLTDKAQKSGIMP